MHLFFVTPYNFNFVYMIFFSTQKTQGMSKKKNKTQGISVSIIF